MTPRSLLSPRSCSQEHGLALLAVLVALTLLLLLALPFAVSMSRGAEVSVRTVDARRVEMLSASARDLLLAEAALGHPTYDATPDTDDRREFPQGIPEVFPQLRQEGRARFGGEVWDLQRRCALDAITPLLLTNLLGITARLAQPFDPDSSSIQLDAAVPLPDSGLVWVDHEVVHYAERQGNQLLGLTRGLFADQGFLRPVDHSVAQSALVIDWRCVLACTWPFDGRTGGARRARQPFAAAGELAEIERAGSGAFTLAELDKLDAALSPAADIATAPQWGRPERVFAPVRLLERTLVVRSALHLGAGSTVRLRNLRTGATEYGLVMATRTPRTPIDAVLPSTFLLDLLHTVTQEFPAIDTVVEPLVPAPVNANTADASLLAAMFAGCRRGMDVRVHAGGTQPTSLSLPMSAAEAKEIADRIVSLREPDEGGPILGFQEFAQRIWKPMLEDASPQQKERLLGLYRMLQTGRDSIVEMGTVPITFRSGPLVAYRAAAAMQRSVVALSIAARHERSGLAVAQPGLLLSALWRTQEQVEEAFRLDQRAPFWLTAPINTGAIGLGEAGNDPVSRYLAHVVPIAYPDAGLGECRYPSRDTADTSIVPGPSSVVPERWVNGAEVRGHESFAAAFDPRGHDVAREGPFLILNTGPKDPATPSTKSTTHELTYPFTVADARGGMGRFGASAWFEPNQLGPGTLLDYSDGDPLRNRMALLVRDGKLVYEVIDEAGIDPDPSQSPAGVDRTATAWELPLAELALPPRTPMHVAMSAYGSRPSDLSVAIDGVTRGKLRHRTMLTSAIPAYDPQQSPAGPPGSSPSDPRYLLVRVESTDGFPRQGVLRIGLELFEYNDIQGNAFVCAFADSTGGRGARQRAREHRPEIPVDANGEPTIDIDQLTGGANLDQFPDHPIGSEVELYGYSALPSWDTLMFLGETGLDAVGGFAVARGYVTNGRAVNMPLPGGGSFMVGTGIDPAWVGDLEIYDPLPTGSQPPRSSQPSIVDTFPTTGGFALLVQYGGKFDPNVLGQVGGTPVYVGGVEPIRYQSRQGNKLKGVQRAVRIPGDDAQISTDYWDGTAHNFVVDWNDVLQTGAPPVKFDDDPTRILNVVPLSIAVTSAASLPNPEITGTAEWVQLYPRGGDPNDTEWVRFDAIIEQRHLVRGNRARWEAARWALTRQTGIDEIDVGTLGPSGGAPASAQAPWGSVTPTTGYIGYIPKVEGDFPQIQEVRDALAFRGDPFTRTTSHAQTSSTVLPCHRIDLVWSNYGALTGRPGRNDRVALVAGSTATGTARPVPEWHTVNWQARQYTGDLQRPQPVVDPVGPDPFQLVAFQGPVRTLIRGAPRGTGYLDARTQDRVVKYPSGELPAAACEAVVCGGAASGGEIVLGIVDEIDIVDHLARDLVVDEWFNDSAQTFLVNPFGSVEAQGLHFTANDLTVALPPGGGLLLIDAEIVAYESHKDGTVQIARNGRGLLGTEARGHDRGARVRFMTHRPAAILGGAVSARTDKLLLQRPGAMPPFAGTLLLNRQEYLHYTWGRRAGDQLGLEMPRAFPPGDDSDGSSSGLYRGRYGTPAVAAGAGEPVISMPFRYWDRYVERNDDPEQACFQFTQREAPVYFRTLSWDEETADATVDVVCLLRADARAAWTDDPAQAPFLRRLRRQAGGTAPLVLDLQATQLEVRFCAEYKPGCLDLATFRAHAWKTAPRVRKVELEYEGEGRILEERVTAR